MYTNKNLVTTGWCDYELLDSGNNRKLERYGSVVLSRPETQAIWKPLQPELWKSAHAVFRFIEGKGSWQEKAQGKAGVPTSWEIAWNDTRFSMKLTSFKHTGVFPEQAPNWDWVADHLKTLNAPRVLNLFGYTGVASIVAAQNGAEVTHVDASKQSIVWAKENAALSKPGQGSIRYITDDALKFTKREVRRKAVYDGIILDPPAFGRGAQGEVWKIEEQLSELMETLPKLLTKKTGSFFLLNGYAAGYTPQSFVQLVESFFGKIKSEFGELQLEESQSERRISSGIYVRFIR